MDEELQPIAPTNSWEKNLFHAIVTVIIEMYT